MLNHLSLKWLLVAILIPLSIISIAGTISTLRANGVAPGFGFIVMWTAAKTVVVDPSMLYDAEAITRLLDWWTGPLANLQPWTYPPSFLLMVVPFGALPFKLAYVVWVVTTGVLYFVAASRVVDTNRQLMLLALVVVPSTAGVIISGQSTFLVAGLAISALLIVASRPASAGALLAVAAVIKPQTVILAPLALLAGGHMIALAGAVVVGLVLLATSVVLFGVNLWIDWLAMLPQFTEFLRSYDAALVREITPTGLIWNIGGGHWIEYPLRVLAIGSGIAIVWFVFRRTDSVPYRIVALLGGSIFCSPHALIYEIALLAPAALYFILTVRGVSGSILAILSLALLVNQAPIIAGVTTVIFILVVALLCPADTPTTQVRPEPIEEVAPR